MPSASGIIPRFDFKQARSLLQKGKTPIEVIAAAERLGDDQLKQQIVMYVSSAIQARLMWRRLGFLFAVAKPTLRDARMRAANRAYAPGGHGFLECERHFDIACGRGN